MSLQQTARPNPCGELNSGALAAAAANLAAAAAKLATAVTDLNQNVDNSKLGPKTVDDDGYSSETSAATTLVETDSDDESKKTSKPPRMLRELREHATKADQRKEDQLSKGVFGRPTSDKRKPRIPYDNEECGVEEEVEEENKEKNKKKKQRTGNYNETRDPEAPESVMEEFKRLMTDSGMQVAYAKDDTVHKYVRYMKILFDSGEFKCRSDFFEPSAREKAWCIYAKKALDLSDGGGKTPRGKLIDNMMYGFERFVALATSTVKPLDTVPTPSKADAAKAESPRWPVGTIIEALDCRNMWCAAKVLKERGHGLNHEVYVHYNGWKSKWDEWHRSDGHKLRAKGSDAVVGDVRKPEDVRVVEQPRDGSCLFHSLAHGLRDGSSASSLRREVVEFIKKNSTTTINGSPLKDFIPGRLDDYCREMSQKRTYGTAFEMRVVSLMKRVNVYVYQECVGGFVHKYSSDAPLSGSGDKPRTVRVLYRPKEEHYDALEM